MGTTGGPDLPAVPRPGPRGTAVVRFLAVGVPAEVRGRLARATAHLRGSGAALRANQPAGWHVTLAFLGEVDDQRAHVATEVLSSTLATSAARPAPRLSLGRADRFGDRVLVLHLTDEPEGALGRFVTVLHSELRAAGLAVPDRPFRPHLTLARARGRRRVRARDVADVRLPALSWRPDTVGRWASVPAAGGSPYTVEVELPWPAPG
ncbi:MAG: RNA 2',3'-cyclic phosphodiesterase [Nitriliruptoraceae bacterium]